jgi:diguanylate cyclase (GGDEF)-like protein
MLSTARWLIVVAVGIALAAAIVLGASRVGTLSSSITGSISLALAFVSVLWAAWILSGQRSRSWAFQALAICLVTSASLATGILLIEHRDGTIPEWVDYVRVIGAVVGCVSAAVMLRDQSAGIRLTQHISLAALMAASITGSVLLATAATTTRDLPESVSRWTLATALIVIPLFASLELAAAEASTDARRSVLPSSLTLSWLCISIAFAGAGIDLLLKERIVAPKTDWSLLVAGGFLAISALRALGFTEFDSPYQPGVAPEFDPEDGLDLRGWFGIVIPYAAIAAAASGAWALRDSSYSWLSAILGSLAVLVLGRQAFAHVGGTRAARRSEQARLDFARRAMIDPVTELPNRRALDERLEEEVERALRFKEPLSLCFVDLDHFKSVNDIYGHATGDAVLKHVGMVLRRASRGVDFVGRFGGEEFVVLVPGVWSEESIQLADRLRLAIAETEFFSTNKKRFRLSASVGIAGLPEHALDGALLCIRADEALYTAKRQGRDRVVVYSPTELQVDHNLPTSLS